MRVERFLLVALLAFAVLGGYAAAQGTARTTLVVSVMNYADKVPVPGLPVRFTVSGASGGPSLSFNGTTSYNGSVELEAYSSGVVSVTGLSIGDNYTLVMVGSSPVISYSLPYGSLSTSVSYEGYYSEDFSTYSQVFQPSLTQIGGHPVQELILWVLPGRAVSVADYDLLTGEFDQPVMSPSLPVSGSGEYFVPIGFPISVTVVSQTGLVTPTFQVTINASQRWINWSTLYFENYVNDTLNRLAGEVNYYQATGFAFSNTQAYSAAIPLYEQALYYLKRGDYALASQYFSQAQNLASSVTGQVSSFFQYAWVTTLIILVLIYGLSLIASNPFAQRLGRKGSKFAPLTIYVPLALALAYTQPYASAALASLFGLPIPLSPAQTLFLALAVFSLVYVVLALIKREISGGFSSFVGRMAMENLKKSKWRALLIILPIAIVVSSSMSIVNVSFQYGMVKVSQGSMAYGGPLVAVGLNAKQGEASSTWITSLPWVNSSSSIYYFPSTFFVNGTAASPISLEVVTSSGTDFLRNAYYVPSNAWRFTGINRSALVGSLPSPGQPQVLLPSGLTGVTLGSPVRLILVTSVTTSSGLATSYYDLGTYSVSGFYGSGAFTSGSGFLGNFAGNAFLSIPLSGMQPRYVFLIPKPGINVTSLAQQLATITGLPAIAANGGKWAEFAFTYLLGVTHGSAAVGPVLISMFLAYSFTSLFVEERRRDTKLMATLGGTPRELAGMTLTEISAIGLISVSVGVFGSYLLNLFEVFFVHGRALQQAWSLNALLLGLTIGLVIPVAGALLAVNRFEETKVIGGPKKRVIPSEAKQEGGNSIYQLPIKIGEDESGLFLRYLKDVVLSSPTLKRLNPQLNVSESDQFTLKMDAKWRMAMGSPETITIRSVVDGSLMSFEMVYPPILSSDHEFQEFLYSLERLFLEYPIWRDKNVKVTVTRKAVTRGSERVQAREKERGVDDLVKEIATIKEVVDEYRTKLEELESMRGEVSPVIYAEFEKKYRTALREALSRLRPLAERAAEYRDPLKRDLSNYVKVLNSLEASKRLGDISEQEYSSRKSTYEAELELTRTRLAMIEWAFSELSAPQRSLDFNRVRSFLNGGRSFTSKGAYACRFIFRFSSMGSHPVGGSSGLVVDC